MGGMTYKVDPYSGCPLISGGFGYLIGGWYLTPLTLVPPMRYPFLLGSCFSDSTLTSFIGMPHHLDDDEKDEDMQPPEPELSPQHIVMCLTYPPIVSQQAITSLSASHQAVLSMSTLVTKT